MCGFCGVIHWDQEQVVPGELAAMARHLAHRGPDVLQTSRSEPWVGLGHTRLRVIDVSDAAHQPMTNDARTIWLVYNGEVYNFIELRETLTSAGFRFRSSSDTEVVLRAYELWGEESIQRLDGMFALAIWDGRAQKLLLARDRVGKKPLFYWTDGRCLAFGSEIKALLAHGHVPCGVDESQLPFLLAFGHPEVGRSCYRGIHELPPATFVAVQAGDASPVPKRYWAVRFAPAGPPPTAAEARGRLRELLRGAVRRRLISDVPLGALLSGGIDSTIVVGLMRELLGQDQIRTFSIGFADDPQFDETRYARAAAERFGTEHTVFTVTAQSFELLERLVWHYDQPFGDSSAIPTYLLAQLTKGHVTVALSGDGGDELFAGYTRFLAACWAERLPAWVWASAAGVMRSVPAQRERSAVGRLKRLLEGAGLPLPERYLSWIAYIRDPWDWLQQDGFAREGGLTSLTPAMAAWWDQTEGTSTLSRLLHLNFMDYLPGDLLVKTDRCSMAHGLEVRSPFLDTALIEYVAALPDHMKSRLWRTKTLLREACRDVLPAVIRRRGKMGFGVPLGRWFRSAWRAPLQDYLSGGQARIARYLRGERIDELVRRHLQGLEDAGGRLWLLLTLEVWLRQIERPRDQARGAEVAAVGHDG